jgi:hypothetical protein
MTIDPRSSFGLLLTAICIVAFAYLILPILVVVVAPLGDTAYLAFPPQGFTLRWYAAALARLIHSDPSEIGCAILAGGFDRISGMPSPPPGVLLGG